MEAEEEVIVAGAAYDVPADNYEEFDQDIDPAKLGDKLVQTNTMKGTVREYQLYASRHLFLKFIEKKKAKPKEFRVNLACISSDPEHNKIIVWNWLYGALGAAALTMLLIYFAVGGIIDLQYCIIAGVVTLSATIICTLIFIYLMRDEFIFKSHFGNAELFLMENKQPSQEAFDKFFIDLQQAIDKSHSAIPISERLAGELKMCRRLRDEGVIDEETYTATRSAVFRHEQYRAQGQ